MRTALILSLLISAVGLANDTIDLIGGRAVDPGEYEEVVRISSGRSWCTATVIGPRVLLTAAHCTEENGEVTFEHKDEKYVAVCALAPDYTSSVGDQDMALCKMNKDFDGDLGVVGDVVPKMGDTITLIGYGCIRRGGGGGNDGILRVGTAPVTKEFTHDYYSFHVTGATALCFGDSGGPAYLSDPTSAKRLVTGVNSRGDIRSLSLLTALPHANSIEFMRAFAANNEVAICGVAHSTLAHWVMCHKK